VTAEAIPAAPAMALDAVTLRYGAATVLAGLSLEVRRGEVVALVGPSGAGKTSVLRALLGLAVPEGGAVLLGGAPATKDGRLIRPPEERRLAVIFQDLALWPHMTVEGNLAFGLAAQGVRAGERRRRIAAALDRVGLAGAADRRPGELSGGERQRVAIARALVLEPEGMLFDEPLANLDVVMKRQLCATFRELLRERCTAALYVTHDPAEAAAIADRIAVLERGRIAQAGTRDDLLASPSTDFVRAFAGAMSR
jgi:iron(III) transport system ATP-binding protein